MNAVYAYQMTGIFNYNYTGPVLEEKTHTHTHIQRRPEALRRGKNGQQINYDVEVVK